MFQVATEWNPKQAYLKEIILKKDKFSEMLQLLSSMHSLLHDSSVYHTHAETYMDEVWRNLDDKTFRTMPTIKDVTVAWDIWHITRIEDLTANILIDNNKQVLDEHWLNRLNTTVKDTANAMNDEEIIEFSDKIIIEELREYRNAVGKRTKEIIVNLQQEDMKRTIEKVSINRILEEGGVIKHKDSIWLLDFWGKKTVAGIFLMPITRHQIVHLNDCIKLKEKCKKLNK